MLFSSYNMHYFFCSTPFIIYKVKKLLLLKKYKFYNKIIPKDVIFIALILFAKFHFESIINRNHGKKYHNNK